MTKRAWNWLLLLLVLAAFALRLTRLDFQDIWWDEARNIVVADYPLPQIATAGELDIHPPVYFYLLHGWLAAAGPHGSQLPGQGAFAARFMSLWFGVLLVPLMAVLGSRVGGRWTGLGAAVGAAFLPFLLGEAQETRMYTVTLVWLACAGLQIADSKWQMAGRSIREGGPTRWLLFALFSALALLTHYAAVFALVVLWGWALAWALFGVGQVANLSYESTRWQRLRPVLLAGLLTAVLCLPGLPVALRQIPSYRNPNLVVPSAIGYLGELARVYGLGEHLDTAVARPWVWALVGWLVIGWALAAVTRGRGDTGTRRHDGALNSPSRTAHELSAISYQPSAISHSLFALAWAILPLVIYYLVIRDRSTFATRYISFALPGWLLLGGLALRGWARLGRWAGALAAVALVVILAPGLRVDLFDSRFFREDTRGLVAWLKANADSNRDLILLDQRYPFGFYYRRWSNVPDIPPPAEPQNLAPAQYLFPDINTVADRLTAAARGRKRVYWVRWFESDTDPRGAVPFLLEKFGTLVDERAFRGYTVATYAIAPDTQFELAPKLSDAAVDFGSQVRLTGAAFGTGASDAVNDAAGRDAPADAGVWAVLRWAQLSKAAQPLKATLVLEDSAGVVVGRDDRPILNDRHLAPPGWDQADRPLGVALVKPDPATPPGTYTLKLAVYDPATLTQLPASGQGAAGSLVTLGQVRLGSAAGPVFPEQLPIEAKIESSWEGVRLLGRGTLPAEVSPGDRLAFDLYWQAPPTGAEGVDAGPVDLNARLMLTPVEGEVPSGKVLSHITTPVSGYPAAQWRADEVLRGRQSWQLDPELPAGSYLLALQMGGPAGETSPSIELGTITVAGRPHLFAPPASMAVASGGQFGDFARLLGFDMMPAPSSASKENALIVAPSASTLTLTLVWQAEGASDVPYAISVQLLDENGVLRAQHDQQPGGGAFPTTGWVQDEVLTDAYQLALPADLAPGRYKLIVRMYDPATLAALPVTAADGNPAGDTLALATVEIR